MKLETAGSDKETALQLNCQFGLSQFEQVLSFKKPVRSTFTLTASCNELYIANQLKESMQFLSGCSEALERSAALEQQRIEVTNHHIRLIMTAVSSACGHLGVDGDVKFYEKNYKPTLIKALLSLVKKCRELNLLQSDETAWELFDACQQKILQTENYPTVDGAIKNTDFIEQIRPKVGSYSAMKII